MKKEGGLTEKVRRKEILIPICIHVLGAWLGHDHGVCIRIIELNMKSRIGRIWREQKRGVSRLKVECCWPYNGR